MTHPTAPALRARRARSGAVAGPPRPLDTALLGNAIVHGDAMQVLALLPDRAVHCIVTDIPYGLVEHSDLAARADGLYRLAWGPANAVTFDAAAFARECARVTCGTCYIFCGLTQLAPLTAAFREAGCVTRHGIWLKTNPAPRHGRYLWLRAHEDCIIARQPRATFHRHCAPAVWRYARGKRGRHPTEKPLALFRELIAASTNPGDLVMDPCAGSGTTGHACIELGRRYLLVEQHAPYVDVMWERLTAVPRPLLVPTGTPPLAPPTVVPRSA